jgi:hypothetical protein
MHALIHSGAKGFVMNLDRRAEIDRNYDYFQRKLGGLLADHEGQYALIRHKCIVDFYDLPGTAYRAGLSRFSDRVFSVQEVRDEPIELGHFAVDPR